MKEERELKIQYYLELLGEIENLSRGADRWVDSLLPVLDQGTQFCRGEVFYSIHRIVGDKVRFETGGPSFLLPLRENTKEASIAEGCIGATVRAQKAFRIWNNVETFPEFLRRYNKTRSELVIVIPSVAGARPQGVINLESDAKDAFDDLDCLAFSTIAGWVAARIENEERLRTSKAVLEKIGGAVETALTVQSRDRMILHNIVDAIRTLVSFDAIAIIRYASLQPTGDTRDFKAPLWFAYKDGYDASLDEEKFRRDLNSFTLHVMVSRQTQVMSFDLGDHFGLRKYREQTRYALGIPLLSNRGLGVEGALILEFDEAPAQAEAYRELGEAFAPFIGTVMRQHELARERASLQRTLEALPMMANIVTPAKGLVELLENSGRQIAKSLRSSGCAFYEINGGTLNQLAWWGETESNAFWLRTLRSLWEKKIEQEIAHGDVDFGAELEPSVEGGERFYRIFARLVRLFGSGKDVLFVSFKAVEEDRYESLRFSEVSRAILGDELTIIENMVKLKQSEEQRDALQDGFVTAVRMWLVKCVEEAGKVGSDAREDSLLRGVHEFLKAWRPLDTPYSAIFLVDETQTTLNLSRSTVEHLKVILKPTGRGLQTLATPPPFDVTPGSEMESRGLTTSVWRDGSRISFSVEHDGYHACKDFWETITGVPASRRYFAGVRIYHRKSMTKFGVLTVNGPKPPEFFPRRVEEAEWHLIPMLKILAEELATKLYEIRHGAIPDPGSTAAPRTRRKIA